MVLHNTPGLFLLLTLIVSPQLAHAQLSPSNKPTIYVGIKGDVQSAGIANQNNYGQNEMDYGLHLGVGAGVALTYVLNSRSAIVLEGSYQTAGQNYEDHFKGRGFKKEISYSLISIPLSYRYQLTDAPEGYGGVGTETKPQWYIQGGLQLDRILSPEISYQLDGSETDFLSFVLEGGNPNQAQIEAMGAPADAEELFTEWTTLITGAGGCRLNIAYGMFVTLELRGGISLTDINPKPWRLKNNDGQYGASRNSFFGLHAGLHIRLSQP